jgi:hypothetical protein
MVAEHGWRLLPFYKFDEDAGVWRFQGRPATLNASLNDWRYNELCETGGPRLRRPLSLQGYAEAARAELTRLGRSGSHYDLELSEDCERLRWFLLPQEAAEELREPIAV